MNRRTSCAARAEAPVIRAARAVVESLEPRALLSAVWSGQGDGINWIDPRNWSAGVVPSSNDDVFIETQGTSAINVGSGNQIVLSISTNTPLNLTGGLLVVTGPLQTSAPVTISGGSLKLADVIASGAGQLVVSGSGTLNGVTLDCPANILSHTSVTVQNGLTVNGLLTMNSSTTGGAVVQLTGSQTLGGTGQILMGGVGANNTLSYSAFGTAPLTVQGLTIDGAGTIQMAGGPLLNSATIKADASGQTLTISNGSMTNQGALIAAQGGTLNVALAGGWSNSSNGRFAVAGGNLVLGGAFTTAGLNLPAFTRDGGAVSLTGSLDNSNATLPLTASTGSWNFSGTITGGQISEAGGAQLIPANGTLAGVTLDNDLTIPARTGLFVKNGITLNSAVLTIAADATGGTNLIFQGTQTVAGTGSIFLGGTSGNNFLQFSGAGSTMTVAPGITVHGQGVIDLAGGALVNLGTVASDSTSPSLLITNGAMTNSGTVLAAGSLTLSLSQGFANTSTGKLDVEGGSLLLNGSLTTAGLNLPTFVRNGGTVSLSGSLDNTNSTLALTPATGSWNLTGGTITGGHISGTGGAQLVPSFGTVNGVTIDSDLTIPGGSTLQVQGGLTLNAILTISGAATGTAQLSFLSTQTVSGTGQIAMTGVANNSFAINAPNATVTLGPQITLHGWGVVGGLTNTTLVNQGTILADISGQTLQISTPNFTNQGVATSVNGGILNISSSGTVQVSGGNVVLSPGIAPSSLIVTGGSVAFPGTQPLSLQSLTLGGGSLTGAAPVTLAGPATWTAGTIALSAPLTISANTTLTISGTAAHLATTPLNNAGIVNLTDGTLQLNGGGTQAGSFDLGPAAVLALGGNASQTFSPTSSVSGTGGFSVRDFASVNVTGAYDVGATDVSGGAFLQLIPGSRVANMGTLNVSGGTFSCGNASAGTAAGRLRAATGPVPGNVNVMTAVVLGGGATLVQPGWTLAVGPSGLTFTGSTSPEVDLVSDPITSGHLLLGGDITFAGSDGTAAIRSTGVAAVSGQIDLGAAQRSFAINDGAAAMDMAIVANITNGSLRTSGPGRVQLAMASGFAGGITIAGGATEIDDPAALGTGDVTFAGGTLAFGPAVASLPNTLTSAPTDGISLDVGNASPQIQAVTAGSALNVSGLPGGSLGIAGPVLLQHDLTLNNGVPVTISGAISGGFGFTKSGTGSLSLLGASANTYSGRTTIDGGSLALNKSSGLAVPGDLTVNGPATVTLLASDQIAPGAALVLNSVGGPAVLDLAGHNQSLASISSLLPTSSISLGTATLTVGSGGASSAFAGSVSGSGTIIKQGAGTLTLGPGASLQGQALQIAGGAVACAGGAATNTVRSLVISPGARMDLGSGTLMINYGAGPTPAGTIGSYMTTAFEGGAWSGPGLGTTAAGVTLGFADSADGVVAGLPANTIVIKPAIPGDANLDGTVNFADLLILAQNYGQTNAAWDRGDANYDGTVAFSDLLLLAQHYGQSSAAGAVAAAGSLSPYSRPGYGPAAARHKTARTQAG